MPESQTAPLTCTKKLPGGAQCPNVRADQDPSASNRHCLEHRREQHRKYAISVLSQRYGKGWNRGIEQMRDVLVREFNAQGQASFTGIEIAGLIRRAPGPMVEGLTTEDLQPSNDDVDVELPAEVTS